MGCVLSGVFVLVGIAWALWAIGWVRRVESREALEPVLRLFGLRWRAEGFSARVAAEGRVDDEEVALVLPAPGRPVRLRRGKGPWREVPLGELEARLRTPPEGTPPAPG